MSEPAKPTTLAERLAQSRVGLSPELEVSRHVLRGELAYVIRNPLSLQSHLFSAQDYWILTHIRSERSLAEVFDELVEDDVLTPDREEGFYQFVLHLHRLGFLQLPISDEKLLYKRHIAALLAKRWQHLTSLFFLQIPLFNPDAFLDRTAVVAKVLFSKAFFAVWTTLVALAVFLAFQNRHELGAPLGQMTLGQNVPLLITVLLALKLFHEFGHAYACKRFGGVVPEMGVFMIVITPCAYVDTTSSWSFPRKRDRLLVCLAGMYVELFFAALGMLVWSATSPGTLNAVAYQVAVLASVVTIGFNINPLMRFDGYYALSDLVEIPNLRARAGERLSRLGKRLFLGLPGKKDGESLSMRSFLTSFAVASAIYKVGLVLGISAVIAKKYFAAGIFLAVFYVGMEVFRLVKKGVHLFFLDRETAPVRTRAAVVGASLFVLLPIGLCALPVPSQVVAPAVLSADRVDVLRAERPGFLRELRAEEAGGVAAGEALIVLDDPWVEEAVQSAEAQLELARIELRVARVEDPLAAAEHEERVRVLGDELETRREDLRRLELRTPATGTLVRRVPDTEHGRFVSEGEPLATVVSGPRVVRALLTGHQVERARPTIGGGVYFRPTSDPSSTLPGSIVRIDPTGSEFIDEPALTTRGGGDIAVDPEHSRAGQPHFVVTIRLDLPEDAPLPHGATGRVWFAGAYDPLATLVLRSALGFRNRLLGQG